MKLKQKYLHVIQGGKAKISTNNIYDDYYIPPSKIPTI